MEFITTEEGQENYIISVDPFVVDVQILNPMGLVEFQTKYPIFRDPRIFELIRLIEYTHISTPGIRTEVNPEMFEILNERFVSILKEKNVLYRIKWNKIPEGWAEKHFILRNYIQTASLPKEQLSSEEYSNLEKTLILLNSKRNHFDESTDKSKLIYWQMEIPFDLSDQNELVLIPQGGENSQPPPSLPPVLPFEVEEDAGFIFGQNMNITIYDSPQIIPEEQEQSNNQPDSGENA